VDDVAVVAGNDHHRVALTGNLVVVRNDLAQRGAGILLDSLVGDAHTLAVVIERCGRVLE